MIPGWPAVAAVAVDDAGDVDHTWLNSELILVWRGATLTNLKFVIRIQSNILLSGSLCLIKLVMRPAWLNVMNGVGLGLFEDILEWWRSCWDQQ